MKRSVLVLCLVLGAVSTLAACGAPLPAEELIRSRYPVHARAFFDEGAFDVVDDGYSLAHRSPEAQQALGHLSLTLPLDGRAPLRFTTADGLQLEVEEEGAGASSLAGGAVVYERDDGSAAVWTVDHGGYEEWLYVENPRPGVVARWHVRGGSLVADEADSASAYVVDDEGRVRLRIHAPMGVKEDGAEVVPALRVEEENALALLVGDDVVGAASVLIDPEWSTVGTLDVARWSSSSTLLPDGQVLVTGGRDATMTASNSGSFSLATRYDPTRGIFTATNGLARSRDMHSNLVLTNGLTLLAEGDHTYNLADTMETFDAGSDTSTSAGGTGGNTGNYSQGTSTRLADGRVLVVGGHQSVDGANPSLTCLECASPVNLTSRVSFGTPGGTWTTSNSIDRARHTATLLPNNKVLIAGGRTKSGSSFSTTTDARLFDPSTNALSVAASLAAAREFHTATLLHDGRVFVAGGFNGAFTTNTTALYTPSTNTWAAGPNLTTSRGRHTAVLMPDGRVVLIGGRSANLLSSLYLGSVEVFDPSTNAISAGPSLALGRDRHVTTLLPDGRVLVTGGRTQLFGVTIAVSTSQVLQMRNLADDAATASMSTARMRHAARMLNTGKILVAGGEGVSGTALATAQVYDEATNTWANTTNNLIARRRHSMTLLRSGKVLIVGGDTTAGALASAQLYDATAATFASTTALTTARHSHTANLLDDGKVLVCGGTTVAGATTSCERFDPVALVWSGSSINTARSGHKAITLLNGKVLLVGGNTGATTAELFDPATSTSTNTGAMTANHMKDFAAALLPDGRVLVAGGGDSDAANWTALSVAELYNPATNTWTAAPNLTHPRVKLSADVLPGGRILILGGAEESPQNVFVEEYDPLSNTFDETDLDLSFAGQATAVALSGRTFYAGGVLDDFFGPPVTPVAYADRYDEGRYTPSTMKPLLNSVTGAAAPGGTISLNGGRFTGSNREATGGGYNDSATNHPLVELTRIEGQAQVYARTTAFTSTTASAVLPANLQRGHWLVRVVVNGSISDARLLLVQ